MIIPLKHLSSICKIGDGKKTCRYIGLTPVGHECLKLTSSKEYLDRLVATGKMTAQADNCEGLAPERKVEAILSEVKKDSTPA